LKYFLHKNTKISFSDSGYGNAIILLHGFLENSSMWDFCIPEMAKTNRVIAIDLLGHGQSECLGYIHTMEDQADMVFAVLQELKIKKATLIGHSMGGYVALAFAELYPENLKSLVLMNSTSFKDSAERKKNRERAIKMVKKDYTSFVRLSISNLFSEANRAILVDEIENVKLEALKTPLQGIIAAQEGMKIRKDRELILKSLKIPVLLILSKKDPVLDYEENIKQIENTKIQLATFADGHMSHIENLGEVLKVLLSFVGKK
jgi:pimeloyl-ACP methyl ester carboxylesterase